LDKPVKGYRNSDRAFKGVLDGLSNGKDKSFDAGKDKSCDAGKDKSCNDGKPNGVVNGLSHSALKGLFYGVADGVIDICNISYQVGRASKGIQE
jgi:hypothetical protein